MFKLKVVLIKYLKEIIFRNIELIFDIEKIILKKNQWAAIILVFKTHKILCML